VILSRTILESSLIRTYRSLQSQIALALPQLNQLMSHTKDAQTGLQDGLDKILEKMETSISEISDHFSRNSKDFRLRRPGMKYHSPQQNTDAKSSPKSVQTLQVCPELCKCRCHYRTVLESCRWHTSFGSFSISTVGSPFDPQASSCDEVSCKKKSLPLLSVVYYFPRWFMARVLGLVFVNGASPTVTLFFPRIVPPDAEIAICIREGKSERIKELLANSSASPSDIIGPYGMTTLSLAISYGQFDVCRLLVGVGAHQYAPNHVGLVSDVFTYWDKYHLQDCLLPPAAVIMDMFNLCCTDRHLEAVRHSLSGPFQENEPYSRLHKSVLGISCDPVDDALRESRSYINDTDILGRTALHWAVCQLDAHLVQRILYCGADPNIQDRDGKTPLHLAAALGDTESAALLVAAGANIALRDCLEYIPMHSAALQGHTSIAELLLDAGSDIEAANGLGETPLVMACLANQARSVELLCDRGSNIEHVNAFGNTPLGNGLKTNGCDVVQILLRKRARTHILYAGRRTLLHLAAQGADERMLEILMSSNIEPIDPEALDDKGYTALQYLGLRQDGDALLTSFEELVRHVRGGKSKGAHMDSNYDALDEFFDTVEFQ
jgi:ankyrin repeat protein